MRKCAMTYTLAPWEGDISLVTLAKRLCPDEMAALEHAAAAVVRLTEVTKPPIRSDIAIFEGGFTWVDMEYDERLGELLRRANSERASHQAIAAASLRIAAREVCEAVGDSLCDIWRNGIRIPTSFFRDLDAATAWLEPEISAELASGSPSCTVRRRPLSIEGGNGDDIEPRAMVWLTAEVARRRLAGENYTGPVMVIALRAQPEFAAIGERRARALFVALPKKLKTKPGPKLDSRIAVQK